jgi:phosphoenolpyruvate synthase/pyruvate phosphate dikinase
MIYNMSVLPALPKPPEGVSFVLTIHQSVLYADLSFRGSLPTVFSRVYGIDYAPAYILYNATEKWFDLSENDPFTRLLSPKLKSDEVAQKYISTTARTARQLVRIAQIVSSPTRWRSSHLRKDLLEDFNMYWDAYEDHMTCLHTFWHVEKFFTNNLINELVEAGFQAEVDIGIPSFAVPSEPNWFALDQQHLAILKSRFEDDIVEDKAAFNAVERHTNVFNFLSTLFNLGSPSSVDDFAKRMRLIDTPTETNMKFPTGLPENLVRLGELERELTFWKTERQDAFSLADHYALPMYTTLSEILEVPLKLIYSMTRDELTNGINGESIDFETIKNRSTKFCLALIDGTIQFYQPANLRTNKDPIVAHQGYTFYGLPTSPGVVRGRVRIVSVNEDNPVLDSNEIIVTSMTRPELGAALDIALAYVTDEGGRLCHAAIVSREKKKPCVVGLGNVTKVLRTGMLIEVDGATGKITVIDSKFIN